MTIDKNNKTAVIDISTDVLIISSAVEVFKLAIDIANAGYKTMVAGKHELSAVSSIAQECGVKILHKEILVNLSGVPGNFKVTFKKDNETVQRIFGAIVVAGHYEVELLNESYGLKFLNNVITLSKLEEILHDYKPEINNIAFLAGFAHEGTVLDTKRVLKCMSTLQDMEEINTYLYINNIKVAQHDVEKEFTTVRDKGAITFKLTEMPQITQTESSLKILFQDPVIRKTVEHSPDLIVVEDRMIPAGINAEIAQILKIDITKSGFLQKDNVHRFPVQSNREGIFVTGHARDVMTYSEYLIDSDNVVLRVKEFLGNGEKSVPLNKAVVNDDKCTICLTCYRCCPHGAIEIDGDRAVISSIACQGCGICASECPMDAIQIIGFNDDDLKVEIKNATHVYENN
ncbi:MAG: hypothetical protein B6I31_05010 [Desulfobacteraceae bacterium 4572_19]|nr:MAG: hypothetical protein B6I31_05010 [Desulfobacteraceae bacterium 4572_19]